MKGNDYFRLLDCAAESISPPSPISSQSVYVASVDVNCRWGPDKSRLLSSRYPVPPVIWHQAVFLWTGIFLGARGYSRDCFQSKRGCEFPIWVSFPSEDTFYVHRGKPGRKRAAVSRIFGLRTVQGVIGYEIRSMSGSFSSSERKLRKSRNWRKNVSFLS